MTRTEQIANAYRAATIKDAWYGPSLAELLAQASPDLATTRPLPGAHSISELLQHLLLWNERVRNTCDAHPLPPWQAEKEWAEPPIPWSDLIASWNQSRDQLEQRLRAFPVEGLGKQVPGRSYAYEKLLEGIVQHTIWHAGQIAMISSMLRARSG